MKRKRKPKIRQYTQIKPEIQKEKINIEYDIQKTDLKPKQNLIRVPKD